MKNCNVASMYVCKQSPYWCIFYFYFCLKLGCLFFFSIVWQLSIPNGEAEGWWSFKISTSSEAVIPLKTIISTPPQDHMLLRKKPTVCSVMFTLLKTLMLKIHIGSPCNSISAVKFECLTRLMSNYPKLGPWGILWPMAVLVSNASNTPSASSKSLPFKSKATQPQSATCQDP